MINTILQSLSCIIEFVKLGGGKTDKMLGKASRIIFSPNPFSKFNNTRALM